MRLHTLVFSSLSLLSLVLATSVDARSTNAKRLAQGLPPQRPRRLYSPHRARDPSPSGVTAPPPPPPPPPPPAPTAAKTIRAVFGSTTAGPPAPQLAGTIAGYLTGLALIAPTPTDPFLTTTDHLEDAVAIYDPNHPGLAGNTAYHVFGNGHGYTDEDRPTAITLSPDTGDWVQLNLEDAYFDQPAGSPPQNVYGEWVENRVWKIDPIDGRMWPQYVNPDGSITPNQMLVWFWCSSPGQDTDNFVYVTANITEFRTEHLAHFPWDDVCTATELELYFDFETS